MDNIKNFSVKEIFELGLKNHKENKFQEALNYYSKLIKNDVYKVIAHYNIGLINEKLGHNELAKKNYQEAIKFNPSFIQPYNNLGILFQKQGQSQEAIEYFKKVIDIDYRNINGYNNLGLVYASLGKYDTALENYLKTLNFDNKNIIAIKSILFLLNYYIPKKDHFIIRANNEIRNLQNKYKFSELLKTENLKAIFKNSFKIINKLSLNINELKFSETQAYRRNSIDLNCEYQHDIFNSSNIIPKFCFSCFKIQIEPSNVLDLIRLFFIFDNLKLTNNNQRKCMVEFRNDVSGNYKAMIYCSSSEEAKNIIDQINPTLKEYVKIKLSIKRGCSEFYNLFPNFKEIDELDKNYMTYNSDWKKIEKNTKIKKNYNKIKLSNSVPGLSIVDFLIIIQWLNYAKKINDSTYKDIDIDFFNSEFIDYKLSNQVEIRKKQFIITS